jgi:hypothetical protein
VDHILPLSGTLASGLRLKSRPRAAAGLNVLGDLSFSTRPPYWSQQSEVTYDLEQYSDKLQNKNY